MIDTSLKKIWAEAAFQYITDNSARYRNYMPDLATVTDYLDTFIDNNFSRDITKQNIYDDDVEDRMERVLNRVLEEEGGGKMSRRLAMAEALKVTYSMGLKL